jgi:hypothetical protein
VRWTRGCGPIVVVVVVPLLPDVTNQGGIACKRHRVTKEILCVAIGGGELGLRGPGTARRREHVGRPLGGVGINRVTLGTDQGGGSRSRHRVAKEVVGGAIGGGEGGVFGPGTFRRREDVSGSRAV